MNQPALLMTHATILVALLVPEGALLAQGIGVRVGASLPVVRAGSGTTCVMEAERMVSCWGAAVGDGVYGTYHTDPVTPTGLGRVKALSVALGQEAACAIRDNAEGTVACWSTMIKIGANSNQVFDIPGVTNAEQVAIGNSNACALITGGTVTCWRVVNTLDLMVGPVAGIQNAKELAVGYHHACVIHADQSVSCWGQNDSGQLGIGSVGPSSAFHAAAPVPGVRATQVAAGWLHTCVVNLDQTVSCWGGNKFGGIGNGKGGSFSVEPSPQAVVGLSGALMVAAGAEFSCALLGNRTVQCWGKNEKGSLGNNSMVHSYVPVPVVNLTNATTVSAGWDHACASGLGRMTRCWGGGAGDKLTNGGNADSPVPVP